MKRSFVRYDGETAFRSTSFQISFAQLPAMDVYPPDLVAGLELKPKNRNLYIYKNKIYPYVITESTQRKKEKRQEEESE